MTVQEIKSIKMGTILTWNPTGELFRVTGFNEFKIKDGIEVKVSGIECDSYARYSQESMPNIFNLSKSSFYNLCDHCSEPNTEINSSYCCVGCEDAEIKFNELDN
jgi:hypothetical protein